MSKNSKTRLTLRMVDKVFRKLGLEYFIVAHDSSNSGMYTSRSGNVENEILIGIINNSYDRLSGNNGVSYEKVKI